MGRMKKEKKNNTHILGAYLVGLEEGKKKRNIYIIESIIQIS